MAQLGNAIELQRPASVDTERADNDMDGYSLSNEEKSDNPGLSEAHEPPPVAQRSFHRRSWDSDADERAPSSAEVFPPPPPEDTGDIAEPLRASATRLYTLSYLVFFSIFGVLARIGLQSLTVYPGAPVTTGIVWANVGGSLLMGFFLEDQRLFREEWGEKSLDRESESDRKEKVKKHKAVKKTIPLYIGLTTGFCGSFTSFSTFMLDVFLALANRLADSTSRMPPRNSGYSFMALVAIIIMNVGLSLSALIVGAHLALAFDGLTPTFPFKFTRRFLDPMFVILGWGCWVATIFLALWPPDRNQTLEIWRGRAVFAITLAPVGCLLRFYVSLWLNSRIPTFPLGTFTINMFGTIVLGMCYDLQRVNGVGAALHGAAGSSPHYSIYTSCQVLQGIIDGFCGAATTVSTWVAELNGLSQRRTAYLYGVVSVGVGLAFLVVIMGSLLWTIGFVQPLC